MERLGSGERSNSQAVHTIRHSFPYGERSDSLTGKGGESLTGKGKTA